MKIRPPSHATVVAYLALFAALGGSAYAIEKIGSKEIENNSIKAGDLKKRKGVKGIKVKRDTLTRKEIDEASLDASRFLPVAGEQSGGCNPESTSFIDCATATLTLPRDGRIVAIASGGQLSEEGPADASCEIRIDGVLTSGVPADPGEAAVDNTDGGATNGFARTAVSDQLEQGAHSVALACDEGAGDVRIEHPTVAAFGINGG